MKLWVETGVKLSRSNIFFTIFNTFSPHEIYKSNDTIIPIETLIESIGGGDLLLKWRKFVLNLERLDTHDRGGNIVGVRLCKVSETKARVCVCSANRNFKMTLTKPKNRRQHVCKALGDQMLTTLNTRPGNIGPVLSGREDLENVGLCWT